MKGTRIIKPMMVIAVNLVNLLKVIKLCNSKSEFYNMQVIPQYGFFFFKGVMGVQRFPLVLN